ncbi:nuclease-related domain-containing protein [Poseidonibacter ostreae]|uniref:NERD domain-containing protein n=1 Tax=Poseidonibacter ostreae TaxID=2654171 RepID=A0A6L4WTV6_9BACT|nr:nuclease-related domain-containing protein [Poseidonibacter ostreae]KAB7887144.1 hypothetical protein GA417_03715 [Poseidonibacter ostreae]KAB7888650.1 hypothetical protein GBG19_08555 [Poseidonibacter ostreae]KAB7892303.1 hypothetical protein GBG18_03365 [Poseidonibacter ostreae]
MLLKEIDKRKEEDIKCLKKKLELSDNEKQKYIIRQELTKLESGLRGEKETAYFIDFNLKDSENYMILHDLRFELDGLTAQIDHLLINVAVGVILVETKNTKAEVTINDDGTMLYSYPKESHNLPNPLAQSHRHALVLEEIFKKYNMKMDIMSYVVFLPDVKIKNKVLPKKFCRADTFIEDIRTNFIRSPLKILSAATKMITNNLPSTKNIENIGKILINEHKPILIDYDKKYRIKGVRTKESILDIPSKEEKIDIISKLNPKNLNKFKDIQSSKKYMGHEMLSFICINCNTIQRKGLNTFTQKEVFCKSCGN